jgi:hypothetical protein
MSDEANRTNTFDYAKPLTADELDRGWHRVWAAGKLELDVMGPKQLEFFVRQDLRPARRLLDVRNRDVGGWRPAQATRSDRRFRRGSERLASPRETTGMDEDRQRRGRLLLLGRGAVLAHRLARPRASGLDD